MARDLTLGRWLGVGLAAGLVFAAGLPARADWLVLKDGSRVETKGTWKQKGKLLVFTRADGTLASLRSSEVDLPASAAATHDATTVEAADIAVEAPKKKIAVITDKDLPHRAPPLPPPTEGAKPEAGKPASPVTVTDWRKDPLPTGNGIMVVGTLHNPSGSTVTNLSVTVLLSDSKGALLATAPGAFATRVLPANGSIEFRAPFPGIDEFTGIKFESGGWGPEPPPAAAPPNAAPPAAPPSPPH